MNLKPYTASAISFGFALACIVGSVQQYMAAQSPGAVVPLAIGPFPGSAVGLVLLAVVGAVAGLWLMPRAGAVQVGSPDASDCCARLASEFARNGDEKGLGLVVALSVHCAGKGSKP